MAKIIGSSMKNIPWQNKPDGCKDPVWRYFNNPIIKRDETLCSNSIFNSAVCEFEGKFVGVFRCDSRSRSMDIFLGRSENGYDWKIENTPLEFRCEEKGISKVEYRYDPRLVKFDDRYFITWCNGYHGPTIGVGYTTDFKTFIQCENAFLPYNRNAVLFPEKIDGMYAMLSRPSDTGHTPFGDIFYSLSPDMTFWGKHRFVMGAQSGNESAWQSTKIGPGPSPIKTDEGWLLFYHGVLKSCNGFVYSFGAALLDLKQPWMVKYRTKPYLLSPQTLYECVGDVPNVTFPCAALCDADTGRIAIYYGCADTVTGLAFTTVDEVINYMKQNSL
ncbi:MAG: glycoside hydrolase family 130 protein [Oscillospiraceae bacterium]